jgi:hypothetical protein
MDLHGPAQTRVFVCGKLAKNGPVGQGRPSLAPP